MLYCVQRHPGLFNRPRNAVVVSVGAVSAASPDIIGEPNQTTLALVFVARRWALAVRDPLS
jgi:hypothetical protein